MTALARNSTVERKDFCDLAGNLNLNFRLRGEESWEQQRGNGVGELILNRRLALARAQKFYNERVIACGRLQNNFCLKNYTNPPRFSLIEI